MAQARKTERTATRRSGGKARRSGLVMPGVGQLAQGLNRLLLLCALALVCALGYRAWSALMEMPVGRIAVAGKLENLRSDEVRRVVAGTLEGGFIGANLSGLQNQLNSLPWVYSASVRRRWPDTLEISVLEQLPIARWGDRGYLNHEAEIFRTPVAAKWDGLPTIDGPEGSQEQLMSDYQRLRDMLGPLDIAVTYLRQDAIGQLEAELDTGVRLQLGDSDFQLRVQRFIDLYRDDLRGRVLPVASVDMRYSSGAAVSFREPAAVAVATTGNEN